MTRDKLRTRLARILGENATTPRSWSVSTLNDFLNDAYRRIVVATQVVEVRKSIGRKKDQSDYVLPETFNQITRVSSDDQPLEPTTTMNLDQLDALWPTRTTTTTRAFLTDRLNEGTLKLYPTPDTTDTSSAFNSELGTVVAITGETFDSEVGVVTSISGQEFDSELGIVVASLDQGALEVWAKEIPAAMTADTDSPNLPAHSHQGIVFLAAALALAAQGERHNSELAQAYSTMAMSYIDELNNTRLPELVLLRGEQDTITRNVVVRQTGINAIGLAGAGN